MDPKIVVLAGAVGFLLGSLSFTRIVGRFVLSPGEDLSNLEFAVPDSDEKFTTTSVSATSISKRAGPRYGCLTSILDMLKVAVPTLVFKLWQPGLPYFLITAALGVAGHNWPLYHRFKGGRGLSAIFGGMLVIDWLAIVPTTLGGMMLGLLVFRDVLVAYVAGLWLMIPWLWFRTHDWAYLTYGVVVNLLFSVAMVPEVKQYLKFKRQGKVDLSNAIRATDMRHMLKLANRFGLVEQEVRFGSGTGA